MANINSQQSGSQNESNSDEGSEPEHADDEQKDASPEQEGSESRPLRKMEDPYRGPEGSGGISAHGIEGETDLRRAKEYAEMVVDTVREGLLVLNFDLRIEAANESFYRLFEVDPEETEGRLIFDLGNGQWDIPELRTLLEKILPERKVMTGFEVTHEFENIGERIMRLNARRLDHHERILLSIEDITEKEKAEERLRAPPPGSPPRHRRPTTRRG
jgi:PAS domain S-box-containing protein